MPIIANFLEILIYIYFEDHNPPHFHAHYNGYKIIVDIEHSDVIKGYMPPKQLRHILTWCDLHHDELLMCWEQAINFEEPNRIEGLK